MKANLPDYYSRIEENSMYPAYRVTFVNCRTFSLVLVSSQVEAMAVGDGKRQTRGGNCHHSMC